MAEVKVEYSQRGFKYADKIEAAYGGYVAVRESSAAMSAHLWLDAVEPVDLNGYVGGTNMELKEMTTLHLSAAQARQLRDTLDYMLVNHYHGDRSIEDPPDEDDDW